MARQIESLIRGFENTEFYVERSMNDMPAYCYLCGCIMEDSSWRVFRYTQVKGYSAVERYDLDEVCYHALLVVSGYSEAAVSLPMEFDTAFSHMQKNSPEALIQAHWRYSKHYQQAQRDR